MKLKMVAKLKNFTKAPVKLMRKWGKFKRTMKPFKMMEKKIGKLPSDLTKFSCFSIFLYFMDLHIIK